MAILATDNFTRADNASLSSPWNPNVGDSDANGFKIVSNTAQPDNVTQDSSEGNSAVTWPTDYYAEVTYAATAADGLGAGSGPSVYQSITAKTMYRAVGNASGCELLRFNAGVSGSLFSGAGTTFTAGDKLRLEIRVNGANRDWILKKNGIQFASGSDTSPLTTSAQAGIAHSSTSTTTSVSFWEAGDFTSAATGQAASFTGRAVTLGPRARRMAPQQFPTPAPADTVTPGPTATPFHIGGATGERGFPSRRMIPQQYPDTIPFIPDGSATQTPFRIGRGGGIGAPTRRMFPQRYPDSVAVNPNVTRPLTGVSETSAVGTLGVQHTNAIAGVSTTTAVGSVKATLTKALTGVSTTTSVGTLGVTRAKALAGISTATTAGTMLSSRTVPITGVQATGSVGTVTATTGTVIALTGVSASLSVGTLIAIAQSSIIATGGGASGAHHYRQPPWWGDEKKRKLEKKVEAVQKLIEKKRGQIDFAPDLYRMERLIEQLQELQKRLMKLLEQIDELNKEAGDMEVLEVYLVYRSLH